MKFLIFLFLLSVVSISTLAEEVKPLPIEIEIKELTPKKGLVKVMTFFYDGKSCNVQTNSKKKRNQDIKRCKKIVDSLDKEIQQKDLPSAFINPNGTYWNVKLNSSTGQWQQVVEKEEVTLCDSSGKCTQGKPMAARTIAKALIEEFVK